MSRDAFDFLTESILWSESDRSDEFAALRDDEIKTELGRYRAHVLARPTPVASDLAVAMSAREYRAPSEGLLKRSVLYSNEVLLPDPVFELSDWTRDHLFVPGMRERAPRAELAAAARFMHRLTPLVRMGRVRFVPTTRVHEGPERPVLVHAEDAFASLVPERLREWFRSRAVIRKVARS
jgi:hypothetical protein